ncbi:MAG: hypothetical protein FJ263_01650 [Planctomycetes bacterium]|nr:hypothetical protein [Planctomycetota bacterium]
MSIEAPLSKYRKHNLLLIAAMLAGMAVWFWYDGYYSQKFIKDHTNPDGTPNSTLVFNRKSPPYMLIAAAIIGVRFWMIKGKKIVAGDKELTYEKLIIPYDRIDSIDKTYFDKKGFFVIHYRDDNQQVQQLKLSDRGYDNLPAVLDHLTAKLAG